jgi:hypothetical protein
MIKPSTSRHGWNSWKVKGLRDLSQAQERREEMAHLLSELERDALM